MRDIFNAMGLVSAVLLALLSVTSAGAQDGSVISGRLVNGTPEGGSVGGLTVTLHIMGAAGHADLETTADQQGSFRFQEPRISPESSYHVSARYEGALYGVDVSAQEDQTFPTVELAVYEATRSTEALSVDGWWIIIQGIDQERQALRVLEMLDVRNASDRTHVGPVTEMLRFPLLPGAEDFEATTDMYGRDFVPDGSGLVLRTGIPPGEHHVMYGYWVPLGDADSVAFQRTFPLAAREAQIFALPDIQVSSPDLQAIGTTIIEGEEYRVLTAGTVSPGTSLSFIVSGLGPESSLAIVVWATLIGVSAALAITAWLLIAVRRRRRLPLAVP